MGGGKSRLLPKCNMYRSWGDGADIIIIIHFTFRLGGMSLFSSGSSTISYLGDSEATNISHQSIVLAGMKTSCAWGGGSLVFCQSATCTVAGETVLILLLLFTLPLDWEECLYFPRTLQLFPILATQKCDAFHGGGSQLLTNP